MEDIIALLRQTSFEDQLETALPSAEDEPREAVLFHFGIAVYTQSQSDI